MTRRHVTIDPGDPLRTFHAWRSWCAWRPLHDNGTIPDLNESSRVSADDSDQSRAGKSAQITTTGTVADLSAHVRQPLQRQIPCHLRDATALREVGLDLSDKDRTHDVRAFATEGRRTCPIANDSNENTFIGETPFDGMPVLAGLAPRLVRRAHD